MSSAKRPPAASDGRWPLYFQRSLFSSLRPKDQNFFVAVLFITLFADQNEIEFNGNDLKEGGVALDLPLNMIQQVPNASPPLSGGWVVVLS